MSTKKAGTGDVIGRIASRVSTHRMWPSTAFLNADDAARTAQIVSQSSHSTQATIDARTSSGTAASARPRPRLRYRGILLVGRGRSRPGTFAHGTGL